MMTVPHGRRPAGPAVTQPPEIHVQPFHLESITAGADCAVLRVRGEIDVYTAPQLREHAIKLLADGARHITADLREVDFLDSTGLGVLVGSLKRVREQGGSLTLVTAADRILTIFRLTGLDRVFTLRSSFPEAIAGDQHWQAALASEGRGTEEWCREHELL
jgi:anti-sigma B factor antagonist